MHNWSPAKLTILINRDATKLQSNCEYIFAFIFEILVYRQREMATVEKQKAKAEKISSVIHDLLGQTTLGVRFCILCNISGS